VAAGGFPIFSSDPSEKFMEAYESPDRAGATLGDPMRRPELAPWTHLKETL